MYTPAVIANLKKQEERLEERINSLYADAFEQGTLNTHRDEITALEGDLRAINVALQAVEQQVIQLGDYYEWALPIGDWSEDGHEKSDDVAIRTTNTKEAIQEAYIRFETETHMTFDTNRTTIGLNRSDMIRLLNSYGDRTLQPDVVQKLRDAGVDMDCVSRYVEKDEDGSMYFLDAKEVAVLFMECIKSQLPDFNYTLVKEHSTYLFGHYDDKLNISAGYGIY